MEGVIDDDHLLATVAFFFESDGDQEIDKGCLRRDMLVTVFRTNKGCFPGFFCVYLCITDGNKVNY